MLGIHVTVTLDVEMGQKLASSIAAARVVSFLVT